MGDLISSGLLPKCLDPPNPDGIWETPAEPEGFGLARVADENHIAGNHGEIHGQRFDNPSIPSIRNVAVAQLIFHQETYFRPRAETLGFESGT